MVNGKKNLKNCIARTRVESYDGNKFWRVYVWKTSKDLCEQVLHDDDGGCYACHCPMEFYENVITGAKRSHPVMGELHFVSGEWNIETVSHECCHAMMQFNEAHNLKDSQDDEYMTV